MKYSVVSKLTLSITALTMISLTGCSAGRFAATAPASTTTIEDSAATSRSMDYPLKDVAANLRTQGQLGAAAAERLDDVIAANGRMRDLEGFLAATDIAFPPTNVSAALPTTAKTITKTRGGLTITLSYKPDGNAVVFKVVLNGSVDGKPPVFKNFVFCDGSVRKDKHEGKEGYHQRANYYALVDNKPVKVVIAENWYFNDKSGMGSHQILPGDGAFVGYAFDASANWDWTAYRGIDPRTGVKLAHVRVNSDKTGLAEIFCRLDGKMRVKATWKSDRTGQVCGFVTACSDREGCVAFPRK